MHTSHAVKHVQRTGWHTPHTAPRVCAQPGTPRMPALPSGFNPWGRQMYKSRHSSTESLGCPHTSGDKPVPPKSCILLICMDHFPPASIHGKEKAPAFPESSMCCLVCFSQPSCCMSNVRFLEPYFFEEAHQVLGTTSPREALKRQPVPETSGSTASTSHSSSPPCPSTRVNPVSLHARRQRGKCTDEHGIWLPARSLRGHTQPGGMNPKPPASRTPQPPQPASQKAASHPAEGRKGGGRFGSSSVAVPMSSFWWDSRGFLSTPSSSEAHEHFQHR